MLPTMQRPCTLAHNVPSHSLELETWILTCPSTLIRSCKPFSGARNLKMHLCIHIQEKLHKCKHCSYSATQAGSVRRHLVTYSGQDCIVQNVKTFNFGWKSENSHAYPHWGESIYRCPQCTYSTTSKQALGFHSQTSTKRGNSTKRKVVLESNFPSHSAKERLHYVASHSVKLQIWGFTLSLTVGRNHLNQNQNKISPESPLTHSQWRKALHVSTMKQIIQPIWKSEDSPYYLALTLEKTRTIAHNAILEPQQEKHWDFTCTLTREKIHISAYNATIGWKQNKH